VGEGLQVGVSEPEIDGLRLVDPLLAAGGGIDEPIVKSMSKAVWYFGEVLGMPSISLRSPSKYFSWSPSPGSRVPRA
jgi:hypothetical protein